MIRNGKTHLNIGCISGTREVGVDLLQMTLGVPTPGKYKQTL